MKHIEEYLPLWLFSEYQDEKFTLNIINVFFAILFPFNFLIGSDRSDRMTIKSARLFYDSLLYIPTRRELENQNNILMTCILFIQETILNGLLVLSHGIMLFIMLIGFIILFIIVIIMSSIFLTLLTIIIIIVLIFISIILLTFGFLFLKYNDKVKKNEVIVYLKKFFLLATFLFQL
jgi:hypothetical protein